MELPDFFAAGQRAPPARILRIQSHLNQGGYGWRRTFRSLPLVDAFQVFHVKRNRDLLDGLTASQRNGVLKAGRKTAFTYLRKNIDYLQHEYTHKTREPAECDLLPSFHQTILF
jgi:hypothetical protein